MTTDGRLLAAGALGALAVAGLLRRGRLTEGSWNRMSPLQQALVKAIKQYSSDPEVAIRASDAIVVALSGAGTTYGGSLDETASAMIEVVKNGNMGEGLGAYLAILRAQIIANDHFSNTDLLQADRKGKPRKTKYDKLVPFVFKEISRLFKSARDGTLKSGATRAFIDSTGTTISAEEAHAISKVSEWSRKLNNIGDFVQNQPNLGYARGQKSLRLMEHSFGQIKRRSDTWHRKIEEAAAAKAAAQADERRKLMKARYAEALKGLPSAGAWSPLQGKIDDPNHPDASWALKTLSTWEDFQEEGTLGHCAGTARGYFDRTQQGLEIHMGLRYEGIPRFTIHLNMPSERQPELRIQQFVGNMKGPLSAGEESSGYHRGNHPPPAVASDVVIEAVQIIMGRNDVKSVLAGQYLRNARGRLDQVVAELYAIEEDLRSRQQGLQSKDGQQARSQGIRELPWPETVMRLKKAQAKHKPVLVQALLQLKGKGQDRAEAKGYAKRSYAQIKRLYNEARSSSQTWIG